MSDLISRELAMSHPFANGQYDHENANEDFILGFEAYKEWLENLPSVELKFIHCKDCKHFKRDIPCVGGSYNGCEAWLDNGNESPVWWFGYCYKAERRTDEEVQDNS